MNRRNLTSDELSNLVTSVYGLIDEHGVVMYGHESLIGEKTLWLNAPNDDDVEISLEGASLSNNGATLSVVREDGQMEEFTPLIPLSLAKDLEFFMV
jgi:hypothetical protein